MNMSAWNAVGSGAALGAWVRWHLGMMLNHYVPLMPLGTLAANLIGGFLVGVAFELLSYQASLPTEYRLFVITGFLGGLTTFSSFSLEAVTLLHGGRYAWALGLISVHLLGSLAMTILGFYVVRQFAVA